MPMRKFSERHFYRCLIGPPKLKTVVILKRNDDQQQGIVTAHVVFDVWRGDMTKRGQTLQGDMTSDHHTTWNIPFAELARVGINYLSALDRIVEKTDDGGLPLNPWRFWQPQSDTTIDVKTWENFCILDTIRVDPTPTVPSGTNT